MSEVQHQTGYTEDLDKLGLGLLLLACAILSLGLSWLIIQADWFVNDDGFLYLEVSEVLGRGDWSEAFRLYYWPFYSYAIAVLSSLTGLSLIHSGQLLNSLMFMLLVLAFVLLAARLSGNRLVVLMAAVVILVFPQLNGYRSDIIRDPGFWAFTLMAIYFLHRYWQTPGWLNALGWNLFALGACLFRTEGVVLLVLLPLLLLWHPNLGWKQRAGAVLRANTGLILVAALGLFLLLTRPVVQEALWEKGKEYRNWYRFISSGLQETLAAKADALSQSVFTDLAARYTADYSLVALVGVIVSLFLAKLLGGLGPVMAGLAAHATASGSLPRGRPGNGVIIAGLLVFSLIPLLFLSRNYFLTGRYIMPLELLVLLAVPFSLATLYRYRSAAETGAGWIRRNAFSAMLVLMLVLLLDSVISLGPGSRYMQDAIDWIEKEVPADAAYVTNNRVMQYYTGRPRSSFRTFFTPEGELQITDPGAYAGSYLVAKFSRKRLERVKLLQEALHTEPLARFDGAKGDTVLIWRLAPLPERRMAEP